MLHGTTTAHYPLSCLRWEVAYSSPAAREADKAAGYADPLDWDVDRRVRRKDPEKAETVAKGVIARDPEVAKQIVIWLIDSRDDETLGQYSLGDDGEFHFMEMDG